MATLSKILTSGHIKIFLGLIFLTFGCGSESVYENWSGGIIRNLGIYHISESDLIIKILKNENSTFSYWLINNSNEILIQSEQAPSLLHKWCLFWDENESLWFESSDVGGCVWIKNENQIYTRIAIKDENQTELIKEMPSEVFKLLPTWIRKEWGKFRK